MPVIVDLWNVGGVRRPPPVYAPVLVPTTWVPSYAGGFRDRQSRFDIRWSRRYGGYDYGGFIYDAPLAVLWSDSDLDYDSYW